MTPQFSDNLNLTFRLCEHIYLPLGRIERAITWPGSDRQETDVEHSYSLALIAGSLAPLFGLSPDAAVSSAIVHDIVEVHAGDVSVWDEQGLKTKHAKEAEAFATLTDEFGSTSWLIEKIASYEQQLTPEDVFVYALDKLIALVVLMCDEGSYWRTHHITHERFAHMSERKSKEVSVHPEVHAMYLQLLNYLSQHQDRYFYPGD